MEAATSQEATSEQVAEDKQERDKVSQQIETLSPSAPPREQLLRLGDREVTYIQKPLSFFGKLRLFSVLGEAVDLAMSKEGTVSVSSLTGVKTRGPQITAGDVADADEFFKVLARLAIYAPDVFADFYCVVLDVPTSEQEWAKLAMAQHKDDGGLSDDDGIEIIETFIDQNGKVMRDFYEERLKPLAAKVQKLLPAEEAEVTQSSKPSKATCQRTRKK